MLVTRKLEITGLVLLWGNPHLLMLLHGVVLPLHLTLLGEKPHVGVLLMSGQHLLLLSLQHFDLLLKSKLLH